MAKIQEDVIIVKLSRLIKQDVDNCGTLVTNELTSNLEAIVQELVGETVMVEVENT